MSPQDPRGQRRPVPGQLGGRTLVLRKRHKWQVVIALGVVVAGLLFMYFLSWIFAPLLLALFLAYILDPVVTRLEKRMPRRWAVRLLFLGLGLVLVGALAFAIPVTVNEVTSGYFALVGEFEDQDGDGVLDKDQVPDSFRDRNRDGNYDPPEPFTDNNKNGIWDEGEPFEDLDGDETWSAGDEFFDRNGNGRYDPLTELETFTDRNGDGAADPGYVVRFRSALEKQEGWSARTLAGLDEWMRKSGAYDRVGRWLRENAAELAQKTGAFAKGGYAALKAVLVKSSILALSLVLIPVYCYFFLMGLEGFGDRVAGYIPLPYRAETVELMSKFQQALSAFFRGRLVICAIVGVLTATGFALLRLKFGIILGLIIGACQLVPFLSYVPFAPVLIMAGLDGGVWGMVLVSVVYFLGQALDPLLTPYMMPKGVGLHTVTLIVALLVFTKLLGGIGLLVAIPLAACLKIFVTEILLPQFRDLAKS